MLRVSRGKLIQIRLIIEFMNIILLEYVFYERIYFHDDQNSSNSSLGFNEFQSGLQSTHSSWQILDSLFIQIFRD